MSPEKYFSDQLERTDKWLTFAEAKNAALIALNVAMCGILGKLIGSEYALAVSPCFSKLLLVDCTLFVISLLIAVYTFLPDLSNTSNSREKNNMTQKRNLIFYRDIQWFENPQDYIQYFCKYYNYCEKDILKPIFIDFASEIIINSQITVRKYNFFKKALYVDSLAFLLFLLGLIL